MSLSKSTYHSNKTIENFSFSSEKTITKKACYDFLYEKENHLGNVHVVISDRKLPVDDGVYDSNGNQTSTTPDGIFDYYEPDVVFAADYYDGVGMVMPGRLFVTEDHRYGAQGSEVDQEIDGSRDRITTYYRQGNLKTMRWDSPDPKASLMPWQSPYAMFDNNPVSLNDPMGDCPTCGVPATVKEDGTTTTAQDNTYIPPKDPLAIPNPGSGTPQEKGLLDKTTDILRDMDNFLFSQDKGWQSGYMFTSKNAPVATEDYGTPTEQIPVGPLLDVMSKKTVGGPTTKDMVGVAGGITKSVNNTAKIVKVTENNTNTDMVKTNTQAHNKSDLKLSPSEFRYKKIAQLSNGQITNIWDAGNGYWVSKSDGSTTEASAEEVELLKGFIIKENP